MEFCVYSISASLWSHPLVMFIYLQDANWQMDVLILFPTALLYFISKMQIDKWMFSTSVFVIPFFFLFSQMKKSKMGNDCVFVLLS